MMISRLQSYADLLGVSYVEFNRAHFCIDVHRIVL